MYRDKGTTGQAKNLAKGRDGSGQPKSGTGRAGTAKKRDGTRDKTDRAEKDILKQKKDALKQDIWSFLRKFFGAIKNEKMFILSQDMFVKYA